VQDGYRLARASHDVVPMATALNMALAHIESLTSRSTKTAKPRKTAASLRPASATEPGCKSATKR
jgi:hypothetical protein